MTIEHLAPQSDKKIARVGEIGNLIWVPESLNLDLAAKSFAEMQKILLSASGVWVPDDVKSASSWDDAVIEARTVQLAETSYKEIWALP